jgi:hypothetical protein
MSSGSLCLRAVKPLTHFFAGLKIRRGLLLDRNSHSSARVAADASWTTLDRKGAKSPQLDLVAARKGGADPAQDGVHDLLYVKMIEVPVLLGNAPLAPASSYWPSPAPAQFEPS